MRKKIIERDIRKKTDGTLPLSPEPGAMHGRVPVHS